MGLSEIQAQFLQHKQMLFDLAFLDYQFFHLQALQDETHPNFVVEIMTSFFDDCERIIDDLTITLNEDTVNFSRVDSYVHQLKGCSSSIGARRVLNATMHLRYFCSIEDATLCLMSLHGLKEEFIVSKENLQKMLMLEQQIVAAGESIPKFPPTE